MAAKSTLVDTTKCIGCRGCQVACKQWNGLPAEKTLNRGTYQNPPDLSAQTWVVVRMSEHCDEDGLRWLFLSHRCRHCVDAPCRINCPVPGAIVEDKKTGFVIHTERTKEIEPEELNCPFDVPRADKDGILRKCTMCNDRIKQGLEPACVKACPTDALCFGDREDILKMAQARLEKVLDQYEDADLLDADETRVIYLVREDPESYGLVKSPVAETRRYALKRVLGSFGALA